MSARTPLWHERRFTRLWSARVISRFGSALSYVVLLWITFTETNSALAVTYVGLAEFVPTVAIGLFSGALVDRLDRRRVIVVSTLGRAAAMAALVLALEFLGFHLAIVLAACVAFTICSTFFGPGSQALLPQLVPRESLASANGLFESTESVVGIAGSAAAGGLIVVLGAVPSLGIDAACYFVAAIFILLIGATAPLRHAGDGAPKGEGLLHEVREGLVYLRRTVGLFELTLATLVLNFLFAFVLTFLVVYSTVSLHGDAVVYAILEALLTAGYGVGGLLVGRLRLTRLTGRIWTYSAFAQGLAVLVLVLFPVVPVAWTVFFGVGMMQGILNVALISTVQAIVPERLQGRYFAADNMVGFAAIPAAQVIGGVLVTVVGVAPTFLLAAVGSLLTGVGMLFLRELSRLGYDPRSGGGEGERGMKRESSNRPAPPS